MTDDRFEKVRAEVERLFNHVKDSNFESDSGAFYYLKDLLEFIDSLQEEPVSEDLGEYINDLSKQFPEVSFAKLSRIAVRVAKWQKEQFEKNRLEHCNSITNEQAELEQKFLDEHLDKYNRMPTFLDAIEYGMRLQKEQTMGNNYTKKTLLTMKEYEAIVWAYATLQCEVGNNTLPCYSVKEAKAVIDIIDEFTERVQKQRLIE